MSFRTARSLIMFRLAIAALAACATMSTPASAQPTTLSGSVSTSSAGSQRQQSLVNQPVCALDGVVTQDTVGNEAFGRGSLETPEGVFRLSSHACSGGGPGFGGQANARSHADITRDYKIISSTLPVGTPVMVTIGWAVKSRATAAGTLTHHVSGASASAYGRVNILINGASILNRPGNFTRQYNLSQGLVVTRTGTLNMASDSAEHIISVPIGQRITVFMDGTADGATVATASSVTSGDVQIAMLWGVTSLDPNATAVLYSDPNEPAPPAELATPDRATELLPPRPIGLLPCFTVLTQPVSATSCTPGNPPEFTFSVSAAGAGPFTYRWQIEAAPPGSNVWTDLSDGPLNHSDGFCAGISGATAPMLSVAQPQRCIGEGLPTAQSFRCFIENPCGDLTSNAASLTFAPPAEVTEHPTPASACPGGEATFSVAVDTPGDLSHQWQWRPEGTSEWFDVEEGVNNNDPNNDPPGQPSFIATDSSSANLGLTAAGSSWAVPGPRREFRAIVSTECGFVTSDPATLSICLGDADCDGDTDSDDIVAFFTAWDSGDTQADVDGDGDTDSDDIITFFNAWDSGC